MSSNHGARMGRLTLALALLIALASLGSVAAFLSMRDAGQELAAVANRRLESYKLATELRQSSDDLTRFVRTYVVTGDRRYQRFYEAVLAIRNGELERPRHYERIYWDLVAAEQDVPAAELPTAAYYARLKSPRPLGRKEALQQLMQQAGISDAELAKLRVAQANSDALVALEVQAMQALEGRYADAQGRYTHEATPDPQFARELMHGTAYHAAKRAIMQPIDDFFVLLDQRTSAEVVAAETRLARAQAAFAALVLLLLCAAGLLVWQERRRTLSSLGTTPEHLEQVLGEIASGHVGKSAAAPAAGALGQAHLTAHRLRQLIEDKQALEQQVSVRSAELREAMNQLVHNETLASLGSLVAGVAHELNTPLGNAITVVTSISYWLIELREAVAQQRLKRSSLDGFIDSADAACALLERNLQRAIELIASFKGVAADQANARRRKFELDKLVQQTLVAAMYQHKRKPVRVETAIPADIMLDSFPGLLEQVLIQLVDNAVLHGLAERNALTISVRAQRRGDAEVQLDFDDDGVGMSSQVSQHAFDPFFSTRMGQGGSGLGLYMLHKLVQGPLGGSLELHSGSGQGTHFSIVLPLLAPLAAAPAFAGATEAGPHGKQLTEVPA